MPFGSTLFPYHCVSIAMPKVKADESLVAEIRSFVDEVGGISSAASKLGVEKTMLWRFHGTGRAIERNRLLLRDALVSRNNATKSGSETKSEAAPKLIAEFGKRAIPTASLVEMRALFSNLIALIDAYEAVN
jgi:hypothetical protein